MKIPSVFPQAKWYKYVWMSECGWWGEGGGEGVGEVFCRQKSILYAGQIGICQTVPGAGRV